MMTNSVNYFQKPSRKEVTLTAELIDKLKAEVMQYNAGRAVELGPGAIYHG